MQALMSHLGIGVMRMTAWLPLPAVRAMGWLLGWLLHSVVLSRRKIVRTNLTLCFLELSEAQVHAMAREVFTNFGQAWMDRGWLWHAPESVVSKRLNLTGAVDELRGNAPTIIFGPHFMGMDACGCAVMMNIKRQYTCIYTDQSNKIVDAWMLRGRQRFSVARLFDRASGVREIATSLKHGEPLYLLPDMDFGDNGTVFVPFFGIPTATVPSLSRFARLGNAKVVPVVTKLTSKGYDVRVLPAWQNYPTKDAEADTARMNAEIESYIRQMPAQYYWVHKRFKTRPPGFAPLY